MNKNINIENAKNVIAAHRELNWNPRFQFAKVNPCSGYFLQE